MSDLMLINEIDYDVFPCLCEISDIVIVENVH